jgi:hypothetical protein
LQLASQRWLVHVFRGDFLRLFELNHVLIEKIGMK